jgi:hypothetical protein
MPYPESRLYAQDRYDQAARDNVRSRNGEKKLKERQEAWLRKFERGPLDEAHCRFTPLCSPIVTGEDQNAYEAVTDPPI